VLHSGSLGGLSDKSSRRQAASVTGSSRVEKIHNKRIHRLGDLRFSIQRDNHINAVDKPSACFQSAL